MYPDVYVRTPDQVPLQEHFAVFSGGSRYIEGDERSRTNPGHGYPAHTEHFIQYEAYLTEDKFRAAIEEKTKQQKEFRAALITPLTITSTTTVVWKRTTTAWKSAAVES